MAMVHPIFAIVSADRKGRIISAGMCRVARSPWRKAPPMSATVVGVSGSVMLCWSTSKAARRSPAVGLRKSRILPKPLKQVDGVMLDEGCEFAGIGPLLVVEELIDSCSVTLEVLNDNEIALLSKVPALLENLNIFVYPIAGYTIRKVRHLQLRWPPVTSFNPIRPP